MGRPCWPAAALAAYGIGLPAMAMLRIVQSTFYARHDTVTPVRATVIAIACNIGLKFVFVWGLGLGVAGIALGTALGAWINVALLTWLGRSRDSAGDRDDVSARSAGWRCWRRWPAGAGAWLGAQSMLQAHGDVAALAAAILLRGPGLWRGVAVVPRPPAAAAHGVTDAIVCGLVRARMRWRSR